MTDEHPPATSAEPTWQLTPAERAEVGKEARKRVARSELADFTAADRPDPLAVLAADEGRLTAAALPMRHARMSESAYAYFRGAGAVLAADLSRSPHTGLLTQLNGDAHLSNFGAYASPDRRVDFDFNSFEDTVVGPWEWDLKRLVASIEIAGRDRDFSKRHRRHIVQSCSRSYRLAMRSFARMTNLEVWHSRLAAGAIMDATKERGSKSQRKRVSRQMAKTDSRETLPPLRNLTGKHEGRRVIVESPPLVTRDTPESSADLDVDLAAAVLANVADTLPDAHARLLGSYELVDLARLTVGVGTVGIGRWAALLTGRDDADLLFLVLSEPTSAMLAPYVAADDQPNDAARVVHGQRLLQSDADIFLGWAAATDADGVERRFRVRHLRDQRGSADIESMTVDGMTAYARACAWTLADGHARGGDPIAIDAYLGASDAADRALQGFAEAYADQNEADFTAFRNNHEAD